MAERRVQFEPERRTDATKLLGLAHYTADLPGDEALELAFACVEEPHAEIAAVEVDAARAVPGVKLVLTGADIPDLRTGRMLLDQPLLAHDRVRFAGERVAVVAALTARAAQRAASLIRITTRPLAPLLDPNAAILPDAPLLHPEASDYRYMSAERPPVSHPNVQGEVAVTNNAEELAQQFARSAVVFEHTFSSSRQLPGYLEPRATLVEPLGDGRLFIRSTNKNPFVLRSRLAAVLQLPPERFVVDAPPIGGDFGGKGMPLDEPISCVIALRTGRPVRHLRSYEDEFLGANPRASTTMRLRSGVRADGSLLAHEAEVIFDGGAYAAPTPVPTLIGGIPPGARVSTLTTYEVPAARISLRQVYTNTPPAGHVRAPGELQLQFAGERHVELIARSLALDPLEFRRRNAIGEHRPGAGGARFRNPRAHAVLDRLERGAPRPPVATTHPRRVRGRGFSVGAREAHGGTCAVRISARGDGTFELVTAQPNQGAGSHTALRRIAARELGVQESAVRVLQAATDQAPFDLGSAASRVTWVAGRAAQRAASELRDMLARDEPKPVAEASFDGGSHEPGEATDWCFWGYMVDVEADLDTGVVALLDALLVADVGTVINPVAHAGQLRGGFAMGVGAALTEELKLDHGRVATRSLLHYRLPTALDVPELRLALLHDAAGPGPYGAKPVGELSSAGVAPAIANAIADACGAELYELPLTAERVHCALKPGRRGEAGSIQHQRTLVQQPG